MRCGGSGKVSKRKLYLYNTGLQAQKKPYVSQLRLHCCSPNFHFFFSFEIEKNMIFSLFFLTHSFFVTHAVPCRAISTHIFATLWFSFFSHKTFSFMIRRKTHTPVVHDFVRSVRPLVHSFVCPT